MTPTVEILFCQGRKLVTKTVGVCKPEKADVVCTVGQDCQGFAAKAKTRESEKY